MKKILIVSATDFEIAPLIARFRDFERVGGELNDIYGGKPTVDFLVCGPGMVPMTFYLTESLLKKDHDIVINAGIAGSFNPQYAPGDVLQVMRDIFAEAGAESPEGFIPITQMDELKKTDFALPQEIQNPLQITALDTLPKVTGITVNKVSGTTQTIDAYKKLYNPDVESMEGAAFMYVCQKFNKKAFQVRAVSNFVEPRDKSKWQIKEAIEKLNSFLIELIEDLAKPNPYKK